MGGLVVVDGCARDKRDVADARAGKDAAAVAVGRLVAVDVAVVHRDLLPRRAGHINAAALACLVVRDLGAVPHGEIHVRIGGVLGALVVLKVHTAAVFARGVAGNLGALVQRDGAVAAHRPAATVLVVDNAVDAAAVGLGVVVADLGAPRDTNGGRIAVRTVVPDIDGVSGTGVHVDGAAVARRVVLADLRAVL